MIIFPMLLPLGGGSARKPKTNGAAILGVVFGMSFLLLAGALYFALGIGGLLYAALSPVLTAWSFGWAWLAVACLNHNLCAKGVVAGLYILGYFLSAFIAFGSFVGALLYVCGALT